MSSLEIKYTARASALIDSKIAAASLSVEGQLHRPRFAPTLMTVKYDYPNNSLLSSWELDLGSNELISLTELLAGGTDITAGAILRRGDDTDIPPFNRIEVNLSTNYAFGGGTTYQQSVHVTGLHGYSNDEEAIGTLDADLASPDGSTAAITWSTARLGVGDILRIDDERMFITERTWVDTSQTLTADLAASAAGNAVHVSNGAAFAEGQVIAIDVERMLVVDVIGNVLGVRRQWDGTTLAAHASAAPIYSQTGVQLARGMLGTAAAAHATDAVIRRWIVPPQLRDFTKAEAINGLEQDSAGWARVVGSGATAREATGAGLEDARDKAIQALGRKYRSAAI